MNVSEPQSVLHGAGAVGISISADEVLEQNFRVLEIRGLVVIGLPVNEPESIPEVLEPPDELLEVCMSQIGTGMFEEILVLLDELLSTQPAVLIEQVDLEELPLV